MLSFKFPPYFVFSNLFHNPMNFHPVLNTNHHGKFHLWKQQLVINWNEHFLKMNHWNFFLEFLFWEIFLFFNLFFLVWIIGQPTPDASEEPDWQAAHWLTSLYILHAEMQSQQPATSPPWDQRVIEPGLTIAHLLHWIFTCHIIQDSGQLVTFCIAYCGCEIVSIGAGLARSLRLHGGKPVDPECRPETLGAYFMALFMRRSDGRTKHQTSCLIGTKSQLTNAHSWIKEWKKLHNFCSFINFRGWKKIIESRSNFLWFICQRQSMSMNLHYYIGLYELKEKYAYLKLNDYCIALARNL